MYGLKILLAHLVGAYILQNDHLARMKKVNTLYCLLHVSIYTSVLFCFMAWPVWALVTTAALHFIQDRSQFVPWYMRNVSGQRDFLEGPCAPWGEIVVANTFHLLQLYFIAVYV